VTKGCIYPQSNATRRPIAEELAALSGNAAKCTKFYLDTVEGMSNDALSTEGEDHHQGLARTHRLTGTAARSTASTCSPPRR
jgi:hypothetical protein